MDYKDDYRELLDLLTLAEGAYCRIELHNHETNGALFAAMMPSLLAAINAARAKIGLPAFTSHKYGLFCCHRDDGI